MKALAKYDVHKTYRIASGAAQHVRMIGLSRSLIVKDGWTSLPDQEFDQEDPYSFHLAIAHFHRIQSRILPALGSILLGSNDKWKAMEAPFVERAAALWQLLNTDKQDVDADEQL